MVRFTSFKTKGKKELTMNKQIKFILLALVAVTSLALADSDSDVSAKDTKKIVQNNFLETEQKGIKLSGYVDAGYSYNFTGAANGTYDVTGRFGSDTAAKGDFNLYAVKLALEKAMTPENKAQAGFRTDVMIGEDANFLINRNPVYNLNEQNQNSNQLFLEQAYVSIRAPVGNGWDFKVGKFVSILGYEVIERPANMNVTYGLLWQQMPLYYTGVLSSYKFDDYIDAKLGVVNGSQTDNNTTTNLGGDGCAVLAALNVTDLSGNANWSNNFQYSSNNDSNSGTTSYSGFGSTSSWTEANSSGTGYVFIYNSWGNWAPEFADDKLLFAFNALLGTASTNNGDPSQPGTTWFGAGAYAKYQFNDWFSLASRGEYLGGNNNAKVLPSITFPNQDNYQSLSLWEYTLTAGFNVIDNLLIRAEYRLDWGVNSVNQCYQGSGKTSFSSGPAHYAGAEVVYSF
jgi:Putative beta-barrel porin-2, OmpL-like. bbp2